MEQSKALLASIQNNEVSEISIESQNWFNLDAPRLAKALAQNSSVKKAEIYYSYMPMNGIKALSEALKARHDIQDIALQFDFVFGQTQDAMVALIGELNDGSRKVSLTTPTQTFVSTMNAIGELKAQNPSLDIDLSNSHKAAPIGSKIEWLYHVAKKMPDGEKKDRVFLEALNLKLGLDWEEAAKIGPDATLVDVFCKNNAIPKDLVTTILEDVATYGSLITLPDIHLNTAARRVEKEGNALDNAIGESENAESINNLRSSLFKTINDSLSFTPQEAVKIVAEAFSRFDPEMERIVTKAFEDGRISFTPNIYGNFCAVSCRDGHAPDDIKKLPKELKHLPYVSIPLGSDQEKLTLKQLFSLAHECGHLVAFDRKANSNFPLQEMYSQIAEISLHDYLATRPEQGELQKMTIEEQFRGEMKNGLSPAARIAAFYNSLAEEYKKINTASEDGSAGLLMDHVHTITSNLLPNEPDMWCNNRILLRQPLCDISYTAGISAAMEATNKYKAGDLSIPQRLAEVQRMGNDIDFMGAMEHMGVNIGKESLREAAKTNEQQSLKLAETYDVLSDRLKKIQSEVQQGSTAETTLTTMFDVAPLIVTDGSSAMASPSSSTTPGKPSVKGVRSLS